ncbi:MAG TPA: DUF2752 domain-containing protein [Thermoanaerobaculia bacterium]|jgi:hypothetical protein
MARLSSRLSATQALISGAALAAGAWVLYTFAPAQSPWMPQCVFHSLTGLDCPGCGTTRALHALLHGDIAAAWRFNPILFLFTAVALCAAPSLVRGTRPRFVYTPWFGWTSVVVITGYWIVRNTSVWPY